MDMILIRCVQHLIFAKQTVDKPTIIIAHTIKGKGVSFMENNYAWHGAKTKPRTI